MFFIIWINLFWIVIGIEVFIKSKFGNMFKDWNVDFFGCIGEDCGFINNNVVLF